MRRHFSLRLLAASSLLLGATASAQSNAPAKSYAYVWLFSANSDSVADLADLFTADFDEALTQSRCLPKVNRMGKDTVQLHREGEKDRRLDSADYLTPRERRLLSERDVESVILGDISDDLQGGVIRVGVRLDALAGDDLGAASVTINRGRRYDAEERKSQMVKLAKSLCTALGYSARIPDQQSNEPTNGERPESTPKTPVQSDTKQGVRIDLAGCQLAASRVTCRGTMTQAREGYNHVVGGSDGSYILDIEGNQYPLSRVKLGSKEGTWRVSTDLPANVPMRVELVFEGVPSGLKEIRAIVISTYQQKFTFEHIALES